MPGSPHTSWKGFYPKASAIYKKLLKLTPDDESAQLNLAELSQKQGLLADAKAQLTAVEARRRSRGDRAGAAEILVRRAALDPADFDARAAGRGCWRRWDAPRRLPPGSAQFTTICWKRIVPGCAERFGRSS